jgi:hypothetical protein
MHILTVKDRWTGLSNSLRIRTARMVDRPETARRIEALLRQSGHPIAYEVFDCAFVLCAPHLPGVQGDPDISIVIGDAEHDLFYVAQRERGGLSFVSVHEAIHDALRDFLWRSTGTSGTLNGSALLAMKDPS